MHICVGREYRLLPGACHSGGESTAVEDEVTRVRVIAEPDEEGDVAFQALDGAHKGATYWSYLVRPEYLVPLDEPAPQPVAVDPNALNGLAEAIHTDNVERGWYDPGTERSFGDVIALIHSELSEALEEHRNGHGPTEIYYNDRWHSSAPYPLRQYPATNDEREPLKPEGIPTELADVLIRTLDACAALGIDIDHAVRLKRAYNATRPHRHGGKKL